LLRVMRAEALKLSGRPRLWIMIGLLLAAMIAQAAFTYPDHRASESGEWRQTLAAETAALEGEIVEAPEDVQASFRKQIERNRYALEHDIPPERSSAWKFLSDTAHLLSVATLFLVILAAESIASEFHKGTIKLLLVRPVSRSKVLFGKYAVLLGTALLFLLALFAGGYLVGGVLYGFGGHDQPFLYTEAGGAIIETPMWHHVLLVYGLRVVTMVMIITMAFAVSAVFRSTTVAVAVAVLSLFAGNTVVPLLGLLDQGWVKYILFANIDLRQYFEGRPLIDEGLTLGFSVAVLAGYFLLFHLCAWLTFVKRDVQT